MLIQMSIFAISLGFYILARTIARNMGICPYFEKEFHFVCGVVIGMIIEKKWSKL